MAVDESICTYLDGRGTSTAAVVLFQPRKPEPPDINIPSIIYPYFIRYGSAGQYDAWGVQFEDLQGEAAFR